jgi:hypothetical protein
MPTPPDTPTSPSGNRRADDAGSASAPAGSPPVASVPAPRAPRLPSLRVTAALAAGMLALGVVVGAAIGPTPSTSLASEEIPLLLPAIVARAAAGSEPHASTTTVQPPATPQLTPTPTPATSVASASGTSAGATAQPSQSETSPSAVSPTSTPNSAKTPTTTSGKQKQQAPLPPVTSVWLITLSGGNFAQALAQATAAPYIDSQLIPAGTLLSGWSSLAGGSFASEAGLLAGEPPQTLDSIVQPPCPEGAAGAACAPETAGALTAADEFLKATVPSITASAAYKAHGLIVITFATIGNATASSLPAGASTATLSSEPPAGVLLLSPFAQAGSRPTTAFNPTSPKQSLSGLLH